MGREVEVGLAHGAGLGGVSELVGCELVGWLVDEIGRAHV